jgi:hypothetical protein
VASWPFGLAGWLALPAGWPTWAACWPLGSPGYPVLCLDKPASRLIPAPDGRLAGPADCLAQLAGWLAGWLSVPCGWLVFGSLAFWACSLAGLPGSLGSLVALLSSWA